MKRINLTDARKQLEELKRLQGNKEAVTIICASPEPDGTIRATIHIGEGTTGKHEVRHFNSLYDLLDHPGVTNNTRLLWDDIGFGPDIYLPNELIFCFCPTEEIREFVAFADANDDAAWMARYVDLIRGLQEHQFPLPDDLADNPALKDLMINHVHYTAEELVERYKDQKWFTGTAK